MDYLIAYIRYQESQALLDDDQFADSLEELEQENLELERVGL